MFHRFFLQGVSANFCSKNLSWIFIQIFLRGFSFETSFEYFFAEFFSDMVMWDYIKNLSNILSWIFIRIFLRGFSPWEKMDRSIKAFIALSKALNNSSDRNDIRSCITIFERKSAKEYLKENQWKNIRKRIRDRIAFSEALGNSSVKTNPRKLMLYMVPITIFERKSVKEYSKENPRTNIQK